MTLSQSTYLCRRSATADLFFETRFQTSDLESQIKLRIGREGRPVQQGGGNERAIYTYFFKKNFPQKIYKLSTNELCLQNEFSCNPRNTGD